MKRFFSPLGLAWCTVAMCACASSAVAAEPAPGALNAMRPFDSRLPAPALQLVDDDVLSRQTGKYAGASMIDGFVLNLISQWQLPNGTLAVAQGTLAVAENAVHQANAQITTFAKVIDGAGGPDGANPNAAANGGQRVSVNGISQITQVAGNHNAGTNSAAIDFNAPSQAPAPLPGSTSNPAAFASDSSGTVKAGITFSGNGVSLVLSTPAGIASQTISSAQTGGSLAQLLQVAGNRQNVSNQLQLLLHTQQLSPGMLRQMGILQALRNGALPGR